MGATLCWLVRASPSSQWFLSLQSTGPRLLGSLVAVHGLSCSAACGIFLDEGSNLCPLQVGSYSLFHQGSPAVFLIFYILHVEHEHPSEEFGQNEHSKTRKTFNSI